MEQEIQHSVFAVADEPHCAWGWDLVDRNFRFLTGLDAEYFEYTARIHIDHLDGDNAQRAALAIRVSYYLCLETFFSLLGATLQAPDCVVGWILNSRTGQIRQVAEALRRNAMRFPMPWKFQTDDVGFDNVARLVLRNTVWAKVDKDETIKRFGLLWQRLADDFIDPNSAAEYNSIKHGFRARPGGFSISVGLEREYGVPPPEAEMGSLGGSPFGSAFSSIEKIERAHSGRKDPHFALTEAALNWYPDATAARMMLAAISIRNLRSFLLVHAGTSPGEVQFFRPQEPNDYEAPWDASPGLLTTSFNIPVREQHIHCASRDDLWNMLASASSHK